MADTAIIVDNDAEENGLANMLAELIRQNMKQHPGKSKPFKKLKSIISIETTDAGVSLTMFFNRGNCIMCNGLVGKPKLHIIADSMTILELSNVPLRFGLPDFSSDAGKELKVKIKSKELLIKGKFSHPIALSRFCRIVSIHP